jgi:Transposase
MHPKQVAAARARFRPAGGKSDRFDAFVLCELARTDSCRFRVLEPDSDETKARRALTRTREDLVHARVALTSQLRAELKRFWRGPIGLLQRLDPPISLAFLERYPSPADARGLGPRRLAAFLAREHDSRGQNPAEPMSSYGARPRDCRRCRARASVRRAVNHRGGACPLDAMSGDGLSFPGAGPVSISLWRRSHACASSRAGHWFGVSVDVERATFGGGELTGDALLGEGEKRRGVLAAGAGVPDPDGAVEIEGGDALAVGGECDVVDRVRVVEHAQLLPGVGVPD